MRLFNDASAVDAETLTLCLYFSHLLWKLAAAIKSPGPAFTSNSFNFEEVLHGRRMREKEQVTAK